MKKTLLYIAYWIGYIEGFINALDEIIRRRFAK